MSADGATRRVLRWSLAHPLFWPLLALGLLLLVAGALGTPPPPPIWAASPWLAAL